MIKYCPDVDSGVSLNLSHAATAAKPVGGKHLPPLAKDPAETVTMDDIDNHSSEEELEDIIGDKKKVGQENLVYTRRNIRPGARIILFISLVP